MLQVQVDASISTASPQPPYLSNAILGKFETLQSLHTTQKKDEGPEMI